MAAHYSRSPTGSPFSLSAVVGTCFRVGTFPIISRVPPTITIWLTSQLSARHTSSIISPMSLSVAPDLLRTVIGLLFPPVDVSSWTSRNKLFPATSVTDGGLTLLPSKKNTNSTQNKSQTHRAKQYEVTSSWSTDCDLSTDTCSKNVYSLGPWFPCRNTHVFSQSTYFCTLLADQSHELFVGLVEFAHQCLESNHPVGQTMHMGRHDSTGRARPDYHDILVVLSDALRVNPHLAQMALYKFVVVLSAVDTFFVQ